MDVYFSNRRGLGNTNQVTIENYQELIIKIGISKLPENLLKGHQFFSKNIEHYQTSHSIAETIDDYLADLNAYVQKLPEKRQAEIFKEDKGYSGYKWVGKKHKNAEGLSTSKIAGLIKKELEIEFEGIAKFSVTSDVFSGGSSITVKILDLTFNPYTEHFLNAFKGGQSIEEYNYEHRNHYNQYPDRFNDEFKKLVSKVKTITNQYNFNDSDSQTDYFHVGYYDHVGFDEDNYLVLHFPDSKEAKRRKQWDESIAKSKAESKAKADARKGKFKKGQTVFYKAEMHPSWHKFKMPNGMYLVLILKSPNGRARFWSDYSVSILEDINLLGEKTLEWHKKNGADKYYIKNDYGTFYRSSALSATEKNLFALDDPAAKKTEEITPEPAKETVKESVKQETKPNPSPAPSVAEKKITKPKREKKTKAEKPVKTHKPKKAVNLVTVNNYLQQHFDTSGWPDRLKKIHEFIIGETEGFKNIELYVEDETIRALVDSHIAAINQRLNASEPIKKVSAFPDPTPVNQVALSVRFIKRYANLDGKTLTEKQLSSFIKALQKAIITKQIRKVDPHASVIQHIQDQLVQAYNGIEPDAKIRLKVEGVEKYKSIGKSEAEMLSVKLLKRYVTLFGKTDKEKQRKLYKEINAALDSGAIKETDPLRPYVGQAQKNLFIAFSRNGKLQASQEELNGLQGLGFIPMMIAAAVGKGIEHLAHKALKPGTELNGLGCGCNKKKQALDGLQAEPTAPVKVEPVKAEPAKQESNEIMSVNQALNLKFQLIGLDGLYLKLIGEACRPTSFFIYGPGGSGKSTFTLLFGNYMAQKGNRVLYVAGEQHGTPVFTKMLNRLKIKDSKNFGIVKRIGGHDLKNFDIVVIDSKDSLNYELDDFIHQREKYPHLSFVILSQGTKAGGFTGTEKWRNEVDTLIYCESLKAYTNRDKNRWGGSAEIDILKFIPKN
ncbi:MAG: hypothetical protein JST26_04895 [Bacteroidetes bacterium]|nr:hypothetical protein [Bacteroidota bacterium]